jgi:hypothetical protein
VDAVTRRDSGLTCIKKTWPRSFYTIKPQARDREEEGRAVRAMPAGAGRAVGASAQYRMQGALDMTSSERTIVKRIAAYYEERADRLFGEALVCAALERYPETAASQEASRQARFIARVFSDEESI